MTDTSLEPTFTGMITDSHAHVLREYSHISCPGIANEALDELLKLGEDWATLRCWNAEDHRVAAEMTASGELPEQVALVFAGLPPLTSDETYAALRRYFVLRRTWYAATIAELHLSGQL